MEPIAFAVDLAHAPAERWQGLGGPSFDGLASGLNTYLHTLAGSRLPALQKLAAQLIHYFPADLSQEMAGVASATGLDIGSVVLVNALDLLQDVDSAAAHGCTAIVADGAAAPIHGRNLDWALPQQLHRYMMLVEYVNASRTGSSGSIFTGVQLAGMVGVSYGVARGRVSIAMNDRFGNGTLFEDVLVQIALGGMMPTHAIRATLERAPPYEAAVMHLATQRLSTETYFSLAGVRRGAGVVLTRDRLSTRDRWPLAPQRSSEGRAQQEGLVQTNYDHWLPEPASDGGRSAAAAAHMRQLCAAGRADSGCVRRVLSLAPTRNPFTLTTSVMEPVSGSITVTFWNQTSPF